MLKRNTLLLMLMLLTMLCTFCTQQQPSTANYLTFTAEADSSTFGIRSRGNNNPNVQYSLDNGKSWMTLDAGTVVTLAKKGDMALLKGNNPSGFSHGYDTHTQFFMTGAIAASGSVMSLIDGIGACLEIPSDYCFFRLFDQCTSLTEAPQLPATQLASNCYRSMFMGCTGLTQAPALPATQLANCCYYFMFSRCTSLTKAPDLPATKLSISCYLGMFEGCTSLTQAPALPATQLADRCYCIMFASCKSLTQAPALPATTLASDPFEPLHQKLFLYKRTEDGCYTEMFEDCTSLTQAPELPATALKSWCYTRMFAGCTNLSSVKVNFTDWGKQHGRFRNLWDTEGWLSSVADSGTFSCPKALPIEFGENRIPQGWKIIKN